MADPLSWAIGAAATAAVGAVGATAAGVAGSISAFQQDSANAESQANMAEYNAKLMEREAKIAEEETREQAKLNSENQAREQAERRALFASSGAMLSSGSPLAVLGESALNNQKEQDYLFRQGMVRKSAILNEKTNTLWNADIAKNSVNKAGYLNQGFGSIFNGVGKVADSVGGYANTKLMIQKGNK